MSRIEEAKQKTKEKLRENFFSLLDGNVLERKTWDVEIELSAPQIIIPEHFVNKEAHIMVVDLGKFHLTNKVEKEEDTATVQGSSTALTETTGESSDEDEEFCTPASSPEMSATPPSMATFSQKPSEVFPNASKEQISESAIATKMYDRFK